MKPLHVVTVGLAVKQKRRKPLRRFCFGDSVSGLVAVIPTMVLLDEVSLRRCPMKLVECKKGDVAQYIKFTNSV